MTEELLEAIEREVLSWPGVTKETSQGGPGQGGHWVPPFTSYRFGKRELGHIRDNGVADRIFPRAIHDELISEGRARPHAAGFPAVVSVHVREHDDLHRAVELFRMNYDRARAARR
ncbi:MAG: DUF5519 family protein [Armatimonadetes bacterium]|nr:DUF5519 family protein [Armatimonadota bacterium]